jgi:hypothetical protein
MDKDHSMREDAPITPVATGDNFIPLQRGCSYHSYTLRDKLKDLKCPLNDEIMIHHVMLSLPSVFDPFKINYNGSGGGQWNIATLTAMCSHEEKRLR